jgi:hypothetical protein
MTRTEELLALADNTIKADNIRPKGKSILSVRLIEPETIKQLVELAVLQHEALKWAAEIEAAFDGKASSEITGAIAAFEKFDKGGE